MTTAKEFKEFGLIPVIGDKYTFMDYKNSEDFESIIGDGEAWSGQLKTDGGIYDDNQLSMLTPSSFAWRPLNALPDNPKFKYEQDDDKGLWRPLLYQSQTETPEEKEVFDKMKPYDFDEHVSNAKPVLMQEFAIRGGSSIPLVWEQCIVRYSGSKYVVLVDSNGREYSRKKAKLMIRDIDTRTPKQKAIDAIMPNIATRSRDTAENILGQLFELDLLKF